MNRETLFYMYGHSCKLQINLRYITSWKSNWVIESTEWHVMRFVKMKHNVWRNNVYVYFVLTYVYKQGFTYITKCKLCWTMFTADKLLSLSMFLLEIKSPYKVYMSAAVRFPTSYHMTSCWEIHLKLTSRLVVIRNSAWMGFSNTESRDVGTNKWLIHKQMLSSR